MCINGRIGNTEKRNMLNYIWERNAFLGILWGAFNGEMAQVTEGALNAAGKP